MTFGQYIKGKRIAKGVLLRDVVIALDLDVSYWSGVERSVKKIKEGDKLKVIDYFGIETISDLGEFYHWANQPIKKKITS